MNRLLQEELLPGYKRTAMTKIKGNRTFYSITFNPNSLKPNEQVYINIPKLKANSCLVPGSLNLSFDLKISNTKSHFLNNLSQILQARLQIKVAGETLYDCSEHNIISIYKDLWLPKSDRQGLIEYGICSENLRKLISKDDSAATSGSSEKVADKLMYDIYGTRQKINIDNILKDHGLYCPFNMNNNFQYIITLPPSDQVLIPQSGQKIGEYELENIQLEYETIENQEIADEVINLYSVGRSLFYQHITLLKKEKWDKSSTLQNVNVNVPRKSMKGIVLLFTDNSVSDSEEFIFPLIDSVKLTIEGVPNMVFAQGMNKRLFYDEARKFFDRTIPIDCFMTIEKFYKDKFALVIDLRTFQEKNIAGNGKRIVNTQNGILLEIKKRSYTKDLNCYIYVFSDALVQFVNNDLQSIQY